MSWILHLPGLGFNLICSLLTGSIIFWIWFFYPTFRDLELCGIWTIIVSTPVCLIGLALAFLARAKNKENFEVKKKIKVELKIIQERLKELESLLNKTPG